MTIDKAKLKALAEAATPAPWKSCGTWVSGGIKANQFSVADCPRGDEQFIAAANPATVLELLAENALLHESDEEATQLCDALSVLLGEVAVAVRGPEERKSRHGFHDIPSRVKTVVSERDQLKAENARSTEREIHQLAEIEGLRKDLESHKRMLLAAACDVGAIGQALGADEDDDGSEIEGLAQEVRKDAERYRWLRSRDVDTISKGGVLTPQNLVINEETLDEAVDAAMSKEAGHD